MTTPCASRDRWSAGRQAHAAPVGNRRLGRIPASLPRRPQRAGLAPPIGNERAALVVRDNIRHRRDIEDAYLEAINGARDEIVLANAYFPARFQVPPCADGGAELASASACCCREESSIACSTMRRRRSGALLKAGIRVFGIPGELPARQGGGRRWPVGDRRLVEHRSVQPAPGQGSQRGGSDRGFSMTLRHRLRNAMTADARELKPQDWRKLSWHSRLLRWASYQIVRLAIGIASYGGRHTDRVEKASAGRPRSRGTRPGSPAPSPTSRTPAATWQPAVRHRWPKSQRRRSSGTPPPAVTGVARSGFDSFSPSIGHDRQMRIARLVGNPGNAAARSAVASNPAGRYPRTMSVTRTASSR